jgi:hypothetical protein
MKTLLRFAACLALSAPVFAGGPFPMLSCDTLPTTPLNVNVNYATQVFPLLNGTCPGGCNYSTCTDCHQGPISPSNRLVLNAGNADATLLTLLDADRDWIVPLRPELSRLYKHINCDSLSMIWRMPLTGAPMDTSIQAVIYDWIKEGARGTFEGAPLSEVIFRNGLEGTRS